MPREIACSAGCGGAGGAIRLVASRFIDGGSANLRANGGGVFFNANAGTPGRIRFETVDTSALVGFSPDPPAIRIVGPGPLANPVSPVVSITRVGGTAAPEIPVGLSGAIDIVLPVPGVTGVDVATSGVPSGTTVEVKVKPRVGALPVVATVPLTNCDTQGNCTATTSFNLAAGAYVVEARATFQVP